MKVKTLPCERLTWAECGALNTLNGRCDTNCHLDHPRRSFKRGIWVSGWHKGKNCLREPVYLKNVPCCSSLNCLSSLEWKNVGHGGEACQKSLLELQWNGCVCAQKGLRLVFTSALSYPDVVFFIFFLIEFNILRNAQSSLAPRHKRKKPQQHPLTLPPCASQQTFPNKCWRWQTGLGATGWRVLNCALQSPAPRKDEDGEQIMRVGFANSGHRPHLAGLGSTEKDNYRILLHDGCSAEPASC